MAGDPVADGGVFLQLPRTVPEFAAGSNMIAAVVRPSVELVARARTSRSTALAPSCGVVVPPRAKW